MHLEATMRRLTLATTLGMGLALAGCGPTADPADSAKPPAASDGPVAGAGGAPRKGADKGESPKDGPPTDPGGTPAAVSKGMQTDAYRNMPGSEGPGGGKKPAGDAKAAEDKKAGDPAKPADDKKPQVKLSDEEIKNIKALPEADQKLALSQMVCVVGGEPGSPNHLGAMGTPVKQVVKGKTVFLCCESCIEDLKKDPDKYLAKLPK